MKDDKWIMYTSATMYDFATIAAAFPLVQPLKRLRMTQAFAENGVPFYKDLGMKGHNGQDYGEPIGTPTFSCLNGTVGWAYTGDRDLYGYYVFLRTPTKEPVKGVRCFLEVIYAHLDTVDVKTGQEVTEGQKIGTTGNTGKYTTGPHEHFGTRIVYLIDGQEKRLTDNGYFGYSDPALFLSKETKYDEFLVDFRYGKPRNYIAEKTFAFSPVTRRVLGRLPTAREVRASVYGGWGLRHLIDPAMFITWVELTHDEYRAKLRAMIDS